jgi:hypothetical protein
MSQRTDDLAKELLVEVTTLRLVLRAVIGVMVANSNKPMSEVVANFAEALDKTEPELLPLPDVDAELQAKASRLAHRRAAALLNDLGALVAPARPLGRRNAAA